MSRISPLNIVLTSVSLTIIGVTAVFGGISPGLDFGTLLERMLVNSGVATDGTVKNSDKVDGLHASDLLSAAGGDAGDYFIDDFYPGNGCPVGWVLIGTGQESAYQTIKCMKKVDSTSTGGIFYDQDGDGIYDILGKAYSGRYNPSFSTMDVRGLDLDNANFDDSAQKSGTILYMAGTGAAYTNRATMDAHCVTYKPANKSLTNIHAFVSLSPTDEIRDMPNNYGYNPYKPVLLMLNTGSNLNQDGMITDTFYLASGNARKNITWLNLAADFSSSNCYVPIPRIGDVYSAINSWQTVHNHVWIGSNTTYVGFNPRSPDCFSYNGSAGTGYAFVGRLDTAGNFNTFETQFTTGSLLGLLCAAEVQN